MYILKLFVRAIETSSANALLLTTKYIFCVYNIQNKAYFTEKEQKHPKQGPKGIFYWKRAETSKTRAIRHILLKKSRNIQNKGYKAYFTEKEQKQVSFQLLLKESSVTFTIYILLPGDCCLQTRQKKQKVICMHLLQRNCNDCRIKHYNQTCLKRTPLGQRRSGLIRQVTS